MQCYDSQATAHQVAAPRRLDDIDVRHEQERHVLAVLAHATRHYQATLATSSEALQYLRRRGIARESVRRFSLGFARPVWRDLHRVIRDHDDEAVLDSGLIVRKPGQSGDLRFDRFRNRVMFPIRDVLGCVVGFGGRTLSDEECLYAKYMNSPESAIFRKRGLLYGLYEARDAIEQAGSATLVEGYLDVIQLAQHGFANSVATMGTACTHEQLVSVLALTNDLTFCFDGDLAGQRAANAAMHAVLPFASDYRTIRFVSLPEAQDPDSMCREHGADAWREAQARSVSLQQRIVSSIHDDVDLRYAEGRAKLLHQAGAIWRALPAGVIKEEIVSYCCKVGSMSREEVIDLWTPLRGLGRPLANQAANN
jgi:DNA primase